MSKRIDYLDVLKAIAVFLVVFCHFVLLSPTIFANLCMCACWMAVPVFFMVNGTLLFQRRPDPKKHLKKTVGIYAVLVVWKFVYMLAIPPLTEGSLAGVSAGAVLNYLFLFGELPGIINGHLWFIEALLAVYTVFLLFRVLYDWEPERERTEAAGWQAQGEPTENGSAGSAAKNGSADLAEAEHIRAGMAGCKNASAARGLLWFFAAASLFCTNGLYSLGVLGSMLRSAGLWFPFSFDSLAAFQPFGKYGNMLGFFLLGALFADRKKPLFGSYFKQRLAGGVMLAAGLLALWGVKWFLSGQAVWDGVLLQEGYRHVPVVFMAAGLFFLCKDVMLRRRWLAVPVRALASRTLGIFYLHWLFGWMFVNPLAGWLAARGISFGVGTNVLKNIVLMVPAFAATWLLEKLPLAKKLVR